jgi:hypothetical protein
MNQMLIPNRNSIIIFLRNLEQFHFPKSCCSAGYIGKVESGKIKRRGQYEPARKPNFRYIQETSG